jgi:hypothetical protein
VDRRGDGSPTHQPPIERRHHPDVEQALERDGFAIVPTEIPRPAPRGGLKIPRVSLIPPTARLALKDAAARELERTLGLKRRPTARLSRWLIPAGLMSAAILVLLFLVPPMQTFLGRARPAAPRISEAPPPTTAPPVAATPSPSAAVRALPRAVPPPNPEERPREVSASTPGVSGPSAAATPKAVAGPSAVDPPAKETPSKAAAPLSAGLPHADVTRNPAPMSEGGGEAYVVRLSDQAGRPAAGAQVSLLVRTANGALLDIPLGSGPEPGTYHATVPPLDQTPVDLRIRVVMSNRRFEIPLTP